MAFGLKGSVEWNIGSSVTPWYNREEFEKVATSLYSENINNIKWGLDNIKVWQCRTYSALDTIVVTTQALVYAKLRDKLYEDRITFCDESGIQLFYAEALISFVDWISDTIEDKTTPLHVAAKKLNIPKWIVNLRHLASHSGLPITHDLRLGVTFALDFLQREYWQKKPSFVPYPNEMAFSTLINAYKCVCSQHLNSNWKSTKKEVYMTKILSEMKKLLSNKENCSKFFNYILKPTVFFISPTILSYFLSDSELSETKGMDLPMKVCQFWAPFIEIINDFNQIPLFVTHLLECQMFLQPFYQRYACAWAYKLIKLVVDDVKTSGTWDPIHCIYAKRKWSFDWYPITYTSFANPSIYMPAILSMVLEKVYPPFKPYVKSGITTLLAMFLGVLPLDCKDEYISKLRMSIGFEVASSPHLLEYEDVKQPFSEWQEVPDDFDDWETIPLGYILNAPSDFIESLPEIKADDAPVDKTASNVTSNNFASNVTSNNFASNVTSNNFASNVTSNNFASNVTFDKSQHVLSASEDSQPNSSNSTTMLRSNEVMECIY